MAAPRMWRAFFGAKERSERGDVFGRAQAAQAVFGGGLLLELFDRFSHAFAAPRARQASSGRNLPRCAVPNSLAREHATELIRRS